MLLNAHCATFYTSIGCSNSNSKFYKLKNSYFQSLFFLFTTSKNFPVVAFQKFNERRTTRLGIEWVKKIRLSEKMYKVSLHTLGLFFDFHHNFLPDHDSEKKVLAIFLFFALFKWVSLCLIAVTHVNGFLTCLFEEILHFFFFEYTHPSWRELGWIKYSIKIALACRVFEISADENSRLKSRLQICKKIF